MAATAMTFVVSVVHSDRFNLQDTGFQFVEERTWIMGLNCKMGVDGISILFV
jgi:NADH-quinone oxidoreductase subunit M